MLEAKAAILVVDDDAPIREVVRFALQKAGFECRTAASGEEALASLQQAEPALIVLDIVMPGMDGTEVCRKVRERSDVPIVFLSSKDEELDRILGLELGGDDYVTKPFSPRELVARIKAILRRGRTEATPAAEGDAEKALRHGRLSLDLNACRASWDDRNVSLTVTEFSLLKALMGYPGKVYARSELVQKAYGNDTFVSDRTIDSHIRRIRRKFSAVEGEPIETLHGFGYKLTPCR